MKTCNKNLFLLLPLLASLGLMLADRVTAQTFTTLHTFTATATNSSGFYTNSDGAKPHAGLILSGNALYGTASAGGSSGNGTVFKVNTNGTGFTNLHSFTATSGSPLYANSDGTKPNAGLILSGNTLYGTAFFGGSSGNGTVFAVNTDGTGFTNLHSFTAGPANTDGANPYAGLILSGNTLFGTAYRGGSAGNGSVFRVNTNGSSFTNLHSFTALSGPNNGTNSDGANPQPGAGLILSGNTLYGTAVFGGSSGNGTVFKVNTDGTAFTNLHSFTSGSGGNWPDAGLILSGNALYGTASAGGFLFGFGTVFKVNTDGTGFTNLYSFTAGSDGAYPHAGLILSDNTLYGTTGSGGSSVNGTVFKLNTDGTGYINLYSFTAGSGSFPNITNSDGAIPYAGLILSGNTLYGTAQYGGSSVNGTVFSLFIPPQLTIIRSGATVILSWPTNAAGFTLQSAPAVTGTFTNIPGATNPSTNPISGTQKFYRLSQ